jgi:hypothetical protein
VDLENIFQAEQKALAYLLDLRIWKLEGKGGQE